MRDDDDEDLKLRDWAVPPPPADLVGRVLAQLEAGEDTSVGARFVPMDPPPPVARRAASAGALVAAALVGAAAAAAAVVAVYESGDDGARAVKRTEPAPAPQPTKRSLDDETITHTVPKHTPPTETRRFASDSERRKAWERLVAARALREAGVTGAGGAAGGGGAAAEVSKEDLQASVDEVLPMLAECFEMAGEVVRSEGGTLVAELIVGSEPEVGTIIEEASFLQDRSAPHMLGDPDFTECIHETLMSVEMPPLAAGGQLVIHYPFTFSSDEPEQTGKETAKRVPGQYEYPLPDPSPKQDQTDTPRAGGPEVDEMAHSEKSAEQLADDAAGAARAGQYGKALRIAEEALRKDSSNTSARTTAAIAACNLKRADKARLHLSHLTKQRLGMIRQVCLRNNVNID